MSTWIRLSVQWAASGGRISGKTLTGDGRRLLWILLATVTGVLLIACSNVANLQLARAVSSRHETAVRGALGAPRSRLIRKSLVESMIVSVFAAAIGLGIAWLLAALIHRAGLNSTGPTISLRGESLQLSLEKLGAVIRVNGWVLTLAVGSALLTTFLSDVAAAINGGGLI